jgi:hypothetical protein
VALEAGQAEIGDPDLALAVEHQIRRLDVAVNDALFMRVVQGVSRVGDERGDRGNGRLSCASRR